MSYTVLARKYRPQKFSDVIGQDHVVRTLKNALEQQRIAHGYIFSGHRGIGKTTIARILAMALNCRTEVGTADRPTHEPCLRCMSCQEIASAPCNEGGKAVLETALIRDLMGAVPNAVFERLLEAVAAGLSAALME